MDIKQRGVEKTAHGVSALVRGAPQTRLMSIGANRDCAQLGRARDRERYRLVSTAIMILVCKMSEITPVRIRADFNGLFSKLLCLSHNETCVGEDGQDVQVHEGMADTAFDEDVDGEGKPDNLIASGTVERSPNWLSCRGSR